MRILELELQHFRNYSGQRVSFDPDCNVIFGENAQGKTNLLEAIVYLSCGKSPRARTDREMIAFDAPAAVLEAGISARDREFRTRVELYREDIAVAAIDQEGVDRVTAAQAADELLSLKGVKASFVVFPSGENVQMSARSLGEVNVQVILEALGGGGNSTTAGGQIAEGDVAEGRAKLLDVIEAYFEK